MSAGSNSRSGKELRKAKISVAVDIFPFRYMDDPMLQ